MSTLAIIIVAILAAIILGAWYLISVTPVDRFEDGAESDREAREVVEASRPAPLEFERRPHVRAGTAWGAEK